MYFNKSAELLTFINSNCKSNGGKYNNRRCSLSWFVDNAGEVLHNAYKIIKTDISPGTMSQIVWHLNNGKSAPACANSACDHLVKWNNAAANYRNTCSSKCGAIVRKTPPHTVVDYMVILSSDTLPACNHAEVHRFIKTNCIRRDGCVNRQWALPNMWSNKIYYKYVQCYVTSPEYKMSLARIFWHIANNTRAAPICAHSNCNNATSYNMQTSSYFLHCSKKCASSSTQTLRRRASTCIAQHGVMNTNHIHMSGHTLRILEDKKLFEKELTKCGNYGLAHKLSVDPNTIAYRCKKYNISHVSVSKSVPETILQDMLTEMDIKFTCNNRTLIAPFELDIYIPGRQVAIEVNGLYWHSSLFKDKNYHYNKWKMCSDKGISLYSFTDADLLHKQSIVRSKLAYLVHAKRDVVGARQCKIGNVATSAEFELLNDNHVQGELKARSAALGAYHDGNLVALMNWRHRKNYLEITRYVCDTKASYPGLFSKLMKHMVTTLGYSGNIVSFSNNDHSNGNVYRQCGFVVDKILGPAYWYTKDFIKLENRQRFMKSKIAKTFNMDMSSKTERTAMEELGYERYYDSGKIKWILHTGEKYDKSI